MSADSTPAPAAPSDPQAAEPRTPGPRAAAVTTAAPQGAVDRSRPGDADFNPFAPPPRHPGAVPLPAAGPKPRNPWRVVVGVAVAALVGIGVAGGVRLVSELHRETAAAAARTTLGLPGEIVGERYELYEEFDGKADKEIGDRNTVTYLGLHGIGGLYRNKDGADIIEVEGYEGDILRPEVFRRVFAAEVAAGPHTVPRSAPRAFTLPGGPTLTCGVIGSTPDHRAVTTDEPFCVWADGDSAGLVFDRPRDGGRPPVSLAAFAREVGLIRAEFKAAA